MLRVGDKIFYPMHGAGVIDGVEHCEVMGEEKSYYVLKLPIGNLKVMIPQDNADNVGIRDIMNPEQVKSVMAVFASPPDKPVGSWNKRFQAHLDRMKSGDPADVAAVARNLLLQDRQRKVSSGERRLLDLSKQILVSELVYACDKTPEEVEAWLGELLDGIKQG
ncbi:MAG: CarD family transcriptional regulator [Selenomonadaceae bacterium]|nr:CarD family transcriptional regulator [Selenomonadaceae bacterium]